jgi:FkbM family methyltransferase
VISVEPIDNPYKLLRHMIRKLSLDNVRSMNIAVSDRAGKVTMEVPVNADGEEDFFLAKIVSDGGGDRTRKFEVDVDTIDNIVGERNLAVSFMKIDVEGHELTCLQGARNLLTTQKPALIIEVWGDPDNEQQPGIRTFTYLKNLGYAPYLWKDGAFRPRNQGEMSVNYFFFAPSHAEKFVKPPAG